MQPALRDFWNQGEEFRILFRQLQDRSVVHAYLLSGEKGTGKRTLAKLMGQALLCAGEGERPCGVCRNCRRTAAGEHPDLINIARGVPLSPAAKKDRATIPVDDIREMIRLCGIRSPEGNMHVVLLFDADRMTPQAQNCLLKTLEEPPEDTCLILTTEHTEALLPTVISRCRTLRIRPWEEEYILRVLRDSGVEPTRAREAAQAAGGSIGRALELAGDESYWAMREEVTRIFFGTTQRSDVLKISNQWKDRKGDANQMLQILEHLIRTMMSARYEPEKGENPAGLPKRWTRFAREAEAKDFTALLDATAQARKQLQFFTNFQAVLERLIFFFMGEGSKWSE